MFLNTIINAKMSENKNNYSNIPHFRGLKKKAQHGHYSPKSAITDIMDNVVGKATRIELSIQYKEGKLSNFIISDDYVNGFENINETGTANPMNWTHFREGQKDDNETSEFGTGLKEAACFMASSMHIFTRAVKNEIMSYHHVICPFNDMAKREDPLDSFRFDNNIIDYAKYRCMHPFETGSTIILEDIRQFENMQFSGEQELIESVKTAIAEAYSKIIAKNNDLKICVNGEPILPQHDKYYSILQHPICKERLITTTIGVSIQKTSDGDIKVEKIIAKIYCYGETKYYYCNEDESNTKESVSIREINTQKDIKKCENMFADINTKIIIINSTSTYKTDMEKTHLFKAAIRHIRNGRNLGDIQLLNLKGSISNDGYFNHVYHEMLWDSKDLNPLLGVCSNKQIDPTRKNPLMLAICNIFSKKLNGRLDKRKFYSDNDSDTESVSTSISTISNITMNSTTSKRRGRPPATSRSKSNHTEPIRNTQSTTASTIVQPSDVIVTAIDNNLSVHESTIVQPSDVIVTAIDNNLSVHESTIVQPSDVIVTAIDNHLSEYVNTVENIILEHDVSTGDDSDEIQEEDVEEVNTNSLYNNIQDSLDTQLNNSIAEIDRLLADQLSAFQNTQPNDDLNSEVERPTIDTLNTHTNQLRRTNVVYTRIINQDRTYLTRRDAELQLENLSTFAGANSHINISEDLIEIISTIANHRGKYLFLIDLLKTIMTRPVPTEDAHVIGGSKLAEIHAKYINEDDLELL
jgi:hypothetical protein